MAQEKITYSLGLPVYNESQVIRETIRESVRHLEAQGKCWEIIVVDNASTDHTAEIVKELCSSEPRIRLIVHNENKLYSGSCQTIIDESSGAFTFIMDSDGQFTARDIPRIVDTLNSQNADLVFGRRKNRKDPLGRLLTAKIFRLLCWYYLRPVVNDLNCGIRGFTRKFREVAKLGYQINMANPELYCCATENHLKVAETEVDHYPRSYGESSHKFMQSLQIFISVNSYLRYLRSGLRERGSRLKQVFN